MIFDIIESYSNCDFPEVPELVNLTGVTMNNRQQVLSSLNEKETLYLKRDYNNEYDKYALAVYLSNDFQIGWIPKELASVISPEIDANVPWKVAINKIVGNEETLRGLSVKLFY